MARRRSSGFVNSDIVPGYAFTPRVRTALQLLEDRRLFHPDGQFRTARSFYTKPRLVISPAKQPKRNGAHFRIPHQVGFDVPHRVAICIRRKERREVIHAKRLTRKGSGGSKRRSFWSNIKC